MFNHYYVGLRSGSMAIFILLPHETAHHTKGHHDLNFKLHQRRICFQKWWFRKQKWWKWWNSSHWYFQEWRLCFLKRFPVLSSIFPLEQDSDDDDAAHCLRMWGHPFELINYQRNVETWNETSVLFRRMGCVYREERVSIYCLFSAWRPTNMSCAQWMLSLCMCVWIYAYVSDENHRSRPNNRGFWNGATLLSSSASLKKKKKIKPFKELSTGLTR